IEVLITGFGRFGKYEKNPSWLCAEGLHGLEVESKDKRKVHIQTIQTSVAYSHLLDLIPRIHGSKPSAPEAKVFYDTESERFDPKSGLGPQGNGSPFPEGYRDITIPKKGYFDHVIHIGVGYPDHVAIETGGHKRGYQLPDVKKEKAPIATDQSDTLRREAKLTPAEERERENMQIKTTNGHHSDPIRGFGQGYEQFPDEMFTENDVPALVEWLQKEKHHKHLKQSKDAGRFLCDYIFYASLCEAKKAGKGTRVQFIHVPPLDTPYSIEELQSIVKDAVCWI
ncbi:peptidase C15, pyroglutamyl peptidase I-like protein, partial [Meira miltonrushii]